MANGDSKTSAGGSNRNDTVARCCSCSIANAKSATDGSNKIEVGTVVRGDNGIDAGINNRDFSACCQLYLTAMLVDKYKINSYF